MGNLHPARNERPELSERELVYITLHTNFTRKQINDFHVRYLSFYPRGYVNFDEFVQLYSNELKHLKNPQILLKHLFDHIDTDKNGQLSFKEMLFFKAISMPETDIGEKFRWIFLLYDTNQDNSIDRKEFLDLCYLTYSIHEKILTTERLNELKILFDKFDINHDRKLNCEEFIHLCQSSTDLLELITPMLRNTEWHSKTTCDFDRTTELTSNRMDYLIKRTKFTREQILSYYQTFQKRCQSDRLTKAEFINFYQKFFQSKTSETYCEFLFQAFDSLSSDGFIQFDEYLLAIYIHSNRSTTREKLEWLFRAYDRDRDGFINFQELNEILHALFILYNIDREQFSVGYATYEIMSILDLNNDDRISKQEFLNMIQDKELTKFLAPGFLKRQERNEMMMMTDCSVTLS